MVRKPANPNLSYLLSTMETTQCPICGCKEYRKVYEGHVIRGGVNVTCVICVNCTHLYLNPRPSLAAYAKFYNEDDYGRVSLAVKRKSYSERSHIHDEEFFKQRTGHGTRLHERYLKNILTKNDIVFDFGAGDGAWLFGLREATGCKIDGNEPMALQVEFIKKRLGVNLFHAPIEELAGPVIEKYKGRIKVAIVSGSLQHMVDPMACLRIARSILREDGYLYICNWDIFYRMQPPAGPRRLLREWLSVDHPHYFHKNSYMLMARKAGFEILNFELLSTIRTKSSHMEIFARKAPMSQEVYPEVGCDEVLSRIARIEFDIKRYRAFSLRYRLHTIKKTLKELVRV